MSTLAVPVAAESLRRDATVIGLVGLAHGASHFSQLLLAPLFPWLKDAFQVSYTQLGLVLTIFFVVSCAVQTAAGFVVDKLGPRPVLFGGLTLLVAAVLGFASAGSHAMLALWAVVAGIGNGVFHPADYTLLNRKISKPRLGHAYSAHGITGSLGWALAPALVVPVAATQGWRVALVCAAGVIALVLLVVWWQRDRLSLDVLAAVVAQPGPAVGGAGSPSGAAPAAGAPGAAGAAAAGPQAAEGTFDFLRIPAVWMCFAFFLFYAGALSVIQAFAPEAARQLHAVPLPLVAVCLSVYMVCSAIGMVGGGFLASEPERCERVVGIGMGLAASIALVMAYADVPAAAVPVLFGLMGLVSGSASPSRDMLVKRSTPANASGRVFGVVYSGLDIGQALAPLLFGRLADLHQYRAIWVGLAMLQMVLIVSAFNVRRVRREALVPA